MNRAIQKHLLIVSIVLLISPQCRVAGKKNIFLPSLSYAKGEQHLSSSTEQETCPSSENFSIIYSVRKLTDNEAAQIMENKSFCPLWPAVKNLKINFVYNKLGSIEPFLYAFRQLKNPVSIYLYLQQNKIDSLGLQRFDKLFELMNDLRFLYINLSQNQIQDLEFLKNAFRQNSRLQNVTLVLEQNLIVDTKDLASAFQNQIQLESLVINLQMNKYLNISSFQNAFQPLQLLKYLELYLQNNLLDDISLFSNAFQSNRVLKELTLVLSQNNIQNSSSFATAFENQKYLTYLNINLSDNRYLADISSLFAAFAELKKLQVLIVSTFSCQSEFNLDFLVTGLSNQSELKRLDLNFQYNYIPDIKSFATAFKSLVNLEIFNFNLTNNYITDVSPIKNAFQNLRSIKSFQLDLKENQILSGVTELSQALVNDIGPRKAFCPFYFNIKSNSLVNYQKNRDVLEATQSQLYGFYTHADCLNPQFSFLY